MSMALERFLFSGGVKHFIPEKSDTSFFDTCRDFFDGLFENVPEAPKEDPKALLRREVFEFFKIPPTKFKRSYPPISSSDTLFAKSKTGKEEELTKKLENFANQGTDATDFKKFDSIPMLGAFKLSYLAEKVFPELRGISSVGNHGYGNSFGDKEILRVYATTKTETKNRVTIQYTKNDKPIIQQMATRGCTAAVSAMLIYESGKEMSADALENRNLGNEELNIRDFQKAGLKPIVSNCRNLEELKGLLEKNGSAIVDVNSVGEHVVVVDAITDAAVRIRDPYHGWEVDVRRDAFESRWSGKNVIQCQK